MKKYYLRHMALTGLAALLALQACNREPDLMQQSPTALQAADARAWYLAGGRGFVSRLAAAHCRSPAPAFALEAGAQH
jgi:hypothetical protein